MARILVCPPSRFGVTHLLNPWMRWDEAVDPDRAVDQWERFVAAVAATGADLARMDPDPASGAMVFTRDTAVVVADRRAVVLRNAGRRGDVEPARVETWLRADGFETESLPEGDRIDGGNVLRTSDGWVIGIPVGAGRDEADRLANVLKGATSVPVLGVPLAGARYAHLDMALADLGGRGWLVHPPAFAEPDLRAPSWVALFAGRPVITVTEAEAERLACNVLVLGETVIGDLPPRLTDEIAALGLAPVPVDLSEFRKAGGAAHCLSLELAARPDRV